MNGREDYGAFTTADLWTGRVREGTTPGVFLVEVLWRGEGPATGPETTLTLDERGARELYRALGKALGEEDA